MTAPEVVARQSSTSDGPPICMSSLISAVGSLQDRRAFGQLFNSFAPKVKGYLITRGVSPELSEVIAIETFVTVWRTASTYDPKRATAAAWIFTKARNSLIDRLRHEHRPDHFRPSGVERDVGAVEYFDNRLPEGPAEPGLFQNAGLAAKAWT